MDEQSNSANPTILADSKFRSPSPRRGATGPRTPVGKRRSKYNATKHAIFSRVVLLPGESHAEFDLLLGGLREHYQPEGAFEDFLVDKLTTLLWRYRRLLVAENAEIQKGIAFSSFNSKHQSTRPVHIIVKTEGGVVVGDLIKNVADPEIRQICLGLLNDLKMGITKGGPDPKRDSAILTKLYGQHKARGEQPTLNEKYRTLLSKANGSEGELGESQSRSPEECQGIFLQDLEKEIGRLERAKSIEGEKMRLEELCQYVPDPSLPDRLLRYDASLERNIDRTMKQLERLQQMRLGNPMPPQLNINVDI